MGLSKDEANRIAATEGWFHGLNKILREHQVTNEQAARVKAGMFGLILSKVQEARSEIAKLQACIARMESAARVGSVPNLAEAQNPTHPTYGD